MKKVLALAAASAVALGLNGCISQTGFHWSDDGPKKGDAVKGIVDLKGIDSEGLRAARGMTPNKGYYYLVLTGERQGVKFRSFKFDPAKVLGPRVKMIRDNDLAEFGGEACPAPADGGAWRTRVKVKSTPVDKVFDAKFRARIADDGGAFAGLVQSAMWFDDGDGVAEDEASSDDTYSCGGIASTVLSSKGFFDKNTMRIPSELGG